MRCGRSSSSRRRRIERGGKGIGGKWKLSTGIEMKVQIGKWQQQRRIERTTGSFDEKQKQHKLTICNQLQLHSERESERGRECASERDCLA